MILTHILQSLQSSQGHAFVHCVKIVRCQSFIMYDIDPHFNSDNNNRISYKVYKVVKGMLCIGLFNGNDKV